MTSETKPILRKEIVFKGKLPHWMTVPWSAKWSVTTYTPGVHMHIFCEEVVIAAPELAPGDTLVISISRRRPCTWRHKLHTFGKRLQRGWRNLWQGH